MATIRVQEQDFDPAAELAALQAAAPHAGALASFIGIVRSDPARPLISLTLEHYPAMTGPALANIAEQAEQRFSLQACTVLHRHGALRPGERIVFVGAAAPHRRAALQATEFLIDWLKTKAPFWKRERYQDGENNWVAAMAEDEAAADRWGATP
jgi:molybdopterin synthase catalytic subunit